jgi:hypothetical protein
MIFLFVSVNTLILSPANFCIAYFSDYSYIYYLFQTMGLHIFFLKETVNILDFANCEVI